MRRGSEPLGLPPLSNTPSPRLQQHGLHPFADPLEATDTASPSAPALNAQQLSGYPADTALGPRGLPVSKTARHVRLPDEPVQQLQELPVVRETWKDKVMRALKYRVRTVVLQWALLCCNGQQSQSHGSSLKTRKGCIWYAALCAEAT